MIYIQSWYEHMHIYLNERRWKKEKGATKSGEEGHGMELIIYDKILELEVTYKSSFNYVLDIKYPTSYWVRVSKMWTSKGSKLHFNCST